MVVGIFGENCVGKSTLAENINQSINAQIYTGKDYLRFAKNQNDAKEMFIKQLQEAVDGKSIIYVISEKEDLKLLPEGAIRILVTSDLNTIKMRFAARMHGKLPLPVEQMLENKHGCFDKEKYDFHIDYEKENYDDVLNQILEVIHN